MRHVAITFLISTLRRGAELEQFMGGRFDGFERVIRWVTLSPTPEGISVWDREVSDLGEEFLDFYDLADVEQEAVAVFSDPAEALEFAQSTLGASPTRWVNHGVGQSEFLDYIALGRPDRWPPAGVDSSHMTNESHGEGSR